MNVLAKRAGAEGDSICLLLQKYIKPDSQQRKDSRRLTTNMASRSRNPAAAKEADRHFLIFLIYFRRRSTSLFRTKAQNRFTNRLRLNKEERFFEQPITAMQISDYANALFLLIE
jgi:hypothetical protein